MNAQQPVDHIIRIILLGCSYGGVGKTWLIQRYVENITDCRVITTGMGFKVEYTTIKNKKLKE